MLSKLLGLCHMPIEHVLLSLLHCRRLHKLGHLGLSLSAGWTFHMVFQNTEICWLLDVELRELVVAYESERATL